ncbi:MAG: NHL repeat-containing protein [Caldilineaceae bacterium]|nr:NHL repeat-containing protein [Caldilineaceae bacterium]
MLPGQLACWACGALTAAAPESKEEWLAEDGGQTPAESGEVGSRDNWRERLQDVAATRMRSLIFLSGSPILFAAILVAAVAKDSLGIEGVFSGRGGETSAISAVEGHPGGQAGADDGAIFGLPIGSTTLPDGEERTTVFELVNDSFSRPRGVASANGRIYVVDPEQVSLIVLNSDGLEVGRFNGADRDFVEPVDVAVDSAGNVYVLDAGGGGHISIHDANGAFVHAVPIAENRLDRSRGIDVDYQGRIWVALTPAQDVAAFDTGGQELIRFGTDLEGRDLQPVDVVYQADDAVFVATVGLTTVIRFELSGEPVSLWSLVSANSVDGPHLAADEDGVIYVTQPEQGGLLRIDGDGMDSLQAWVLPAGPSIRKLVGIAAGPDGGLMVTDSENGSVYRIPTGQHDQADG